MGKIFYINYNYLLCSTDISDKLTFFKVIGISTTVFFYFRKVLPLCLLGNRHDKIFDFQCEDINGFFNKISYYFNS